MNSIEVDVFLYKGELCAVHEQKSIKVEKTFAKVYLVSFAKEYAKNGQLPYPEECQKLQFLIDIKGDYQDIIPRLVSN